MVRVNVASDRTAVGFNILRKDEAVRKLMEELKQAALLPMSVSDEIYFMPETVIVAGNSIYLIKPQTERAWLRRQARRDAEAIVTATTRPSTSVKDVA